VNDDVIPRAVSDIVKSTGPTTPSAG
jgi:hypothetical protein